MNNKLQEIPMVIKSEAWGLIRLALILLVLVAAFMVLWLPGRVERVLREGLEARLLVSAATFARTMPPKQWQEEENLQGLVQDVVADTGMRFTLIRADGVVVADSTASPGDMGNQLRRPEVLTAEAVGEGVASRRSETTGHSTLYTCRRVPQEGSVRGYVRLAVDLEEVQAVGRAVRIGLLATFIPLLSLGLVILVWRERRWRGGMQKLRQAARAYGTGNLERRADIERGHELQPLGDLMDAMAEELERRMETTEEERNRLAILVQNMAEPLVALEDPETIMFTNKAFMHFTGSTLQNPRGRPLWEVVRSEALLTLLTDALKSDEASTQAFSPFAGRHYLVRTAMLPVAEGQPRAMMAVFQDVSELKTVERMKSDFVANISHELRTPLQAIQGALETMGEDLPEGHTRFHAMAQRNLVRLNELVRDLLTLHKLEGAASTKPRWEDVGIRNLINDARELMAEHLESRDQTLDVLVKPEALRARLDRSMVEHILINLVANASKYSPPGAHIRVSAHPHDHELILEVEDSGPGIPEEHRERIFERFFRVDTQRARDTGGTGPGHRRHRPGSVDRQTRGPADGW